METENPQIPITELMLKLSPRLKEIVQLRFVEHKSISEITKILGIRKNSVETYVVRAKKKLREIDMENRNE